MSSPENSSRTPVVLPVLAARVLGTKIVMVKYKNGHGAFLDTETRRLIDSPNVSYTNEEIARILASR